MKTIIFPDADGVISQAGRIIGQALPDNAVVVDLAGDTLDLPPATAAIHREGGIEIVGNFIGSGPWYDQRAPLAERETPHHIDVLGVVPPNDRAQPVTPGWEHMAMLPRPLTKAEIKAIADAEADAKANAEAEAKAKAEADAKARVAAITVSDVQFGLACVGAGIITGQEAEAWVAAGAIPANLAAAIETLPPEQRMVARIKAAGEKTFERSSPFVAILGAALGMTPEQLDKLFIAASAL